jgi:hypothetical protein
VSLIIVPDDGRRYSLKEFPEHAQKMGNSTDSKRLLELR